MQSKSAKKEEQDIDLVEDQETEVNPKTDIIKTANNKSPLIGYFIQFFAVAVVFFGIGFSLGQKNLQIQSKDLIPTVTVTNKEPRENRNIDFSLFWNVLDTLPQKYLNKQDIDGQKILYGAISGMVRSLGDPYTAFLEPKQNEAIRSEIAGSYEGVGIQIGFDKEKRLSVIAPLKGTPADREGVLAKDLILKIADKETFDLTLPEAVDLIRGEAGTRIKIQFLRADGDPFEKEFTREKIDVKTVNVEYRQDDGKEVAVISVSRFGERTDAEWDKAVDEILTKNVKGVIVDMRNNPGGLLSSALHIGGEFIRGTIAKQEFSDGTITSLPTDNNGSLLKTPLVVLVNGGSASAAEIFAGAMKDNNRGKIVGEKTFGKGTVQDVIEFPGGSGLHVTIARWLTPKGNSIHEVGIEPDVVVELTSKNREESKDPQMEKALELL